MKKVISKIGLLFVLLSIVFTFPCFADGDNPLENLKTEEAVISSDKMSIPGLTDQKPAEYNQGKFWDKVFEEYRPVIIGISGIVALTFLIFFIVNFGKLGQSAGNPQMRSQALLGIVWCGIACACAGGVTIFFAFFYTLLQD